MLLSTTQSQPLQQGICYDWLTVFQSLWPSAPCFVSLAAWALDTAVPSSVLEAHGSNWRLAFYALLSILSENKPVAILNRRWLDQ